MDYITAHSQQPKYGLNQLNTLAFLYEIYRSSSHVSVATRSNAAGPTSPSASLVTAQPLTERPHARPSASSQRLGAPWRLQVAALHAQLAQHLPELRQRDGAWHHRIHPRAHALLHRAVQPSEVPPAAQRSRSRYRQYWARQQRSGQSVFRQSKAVQHMRGERSAVQGKRTLPGGSISKRQAMEGQDICGGRIGNM